MVIIIRTDTVAVQECNIVIYIVICSGLERQIVKFVHVFRSLELCFISGLLQFIAVKSCLNRRVNNSVKCKLNPIYLTFITLCERPEKHIFISWVYFKYRFT